jgi:heterodisulfide reductase subunit A
MPRKAKAKSKEVAEKTRKAAKSRAKKATAKRSAKSVKTRAKKATAKRVAKPRVKKTRARKARPTAAREKAGTVAVMVAQCESDLSRSLNMASLEKRLAANPDVAFVSVLDYPCTIGKIDGAAALVAKRGLARVVVAGSSERLYGKFFRNVLAQSGIDTSLVEFADISGLCRTTSAALGLINTAVARVVAANPPEKVESDIKPVCVVLGGGIAGMSAATAMASRGIKTIILEKDDSVGGLLKRLNIVFPSYIPASQFLDGQSQSVEAAAIEVRTGVEPVAVRGHVGDFEIEITGGEMIEAGVIIVATGAELLTPDGIFGYGDRDEVVTQVEFEDILRLDDNPGSDVVMIQCVGSRNEERPYCSRICCTASIKNAILIKQKFPTSKVTILSRGFAGYAGDLDRARDMGVEIIRYALEKPPVIGDSTVEVYDQISEMEAHIPYDRIVLAVPMLPPATNSSLATMFKIPMDSYGFLVEPRLKVRPEEYAPRGVFVAGSAHWPSTITESIVQGYGAASRAFDLISLGKVVRRVRTTTVEAELCRGCGRCEEVCRHGAIEMVVDEDGMKRAEVIPIQCVGCGVCVSVCPSGALSHADMTARLIDLTVEAAGGI